MEATLEMRNGHSTQQACGYESLGRIIRIWPAGESPHLAGAQENPRIELAAPAGALWPALYGVIIFTSKVMSAFWTQRRAILFSIFSVRYPGAPLRTMNALTCIEERLYHNDAIRPRHT